MSLSTIGVIGAGSWGTALAQMLALRPESGDILLWGRAEDHLETLAATHENRAYLPGVRLSDRIVPTRDFEAVAACDVVLVVTPSSAIRAIATRLAELNSRAVLVCCSKGIERGSGLRMSEILHSLLPEHPVTILSGPSHAEEVAIGMPTAVVLGCEDEALSAQLQQLLSGNTFRIYTNRDVAGIELGGALKNVFAIAAGVSDGLGFGDNSKGALVTRALAELTRLGVALGGKPETFAGLSGVGDLIVTCFSRHSRNRSFGERLGRGETLQRIQATQAMVAEGVPTTRSAYEQAREHGIDTPVIDATYSLLYEGRSPKEVLEAILSREQKAEEA
ncbi:MAG TPA: NAD(P)H-dependent glycerol-3-phosphate dehydrogenase [Chthoniobacteraceae bacterium]|nr:NAD(P)H-dependent glycerol-3-phosphate dehydrogenase [Chthoniobacteraceae bacterium]